MVAIMNLSNIISIEQFFKGLKEEITNPVVIYFHNTGAINISKNHVIHRKTKPIAMKYHYLRELVQEKKVKLEYLKTKEKIDDI